MLLDLLHKISVNQLGAVFTLLWPVLADHEAFQFAIPIGAATAMHETFQLFESETPKLE